MEHGAQCGHVEGVSELVRHELLGPGPEEHDVAGVERTLEPGPEDPPALHDEDAVVRFEEHALHTQPFDAVERDRRTEHDSDGDFRL